MCVHGRCCRCVVEGRMTGCLLSSLKFGNCCSQRHHVKGVTFHRHKQKVNVHTLPNPNTSLLINMKTRMNHDVVMFFGQIIYLWTSSYPHKNCWTVSVTLSLFVSINIIIWESIQENRTPIFHPFLNRVVIHFSLKGFRYLRLKDKYP